MNYFCAKFLEILTTGLLEIGKFVRKQSVSIFRATAHALHLNGFFRFQSRPQSSRYPCPAERENELDKGNGGSGDEIVSIWENPRIAGFFATLPFLTYLCYKRLKPPTHCIQLRRKTAKIERALSKLNDRCIKGKFVFAILVHVLNRISKSARENCVRPP